MKYFLFLLAVSFLFLSCEKKNEALFSPINISPTLIFKGGFGNRSYNPTRHGELITNQVDWDNFRTSTWTYGYMLATANSVDFSSEMLLLAFDQPIPTTTGTMEVNFGSVVENQNNITATILYSGNPGTGQRPSRLCCFVKIPKSTKPVVFQF